MTFLETVSKTGGDEFLEIYDQNRYPGPDITGVRQYKETNTFHEVWNTPIGIV